MTTTFTFTIDSTLPLNEHDAQLIANTLSDQFNLNVTQATFETKVTKITKGEMIFIWILAESQKPEGEFVMTRQEIADEIGCVVGRIAEIIRDNSEHPNVQQYVARTKSDRQRRSAMKALGKLQSQIAAHADMTELLAQSIEQQLSAADEIVAESDETVTDSAA